MLNSYEYSILGGWKVIDDPLSDEEGVSWDKQLATNGYYGFAETVGVEDCGWSVGIRSANDKSEIKPKYPCIVEISSGCMGRLVFCPDFMDAVHLMAQYSTLVVADLLTTANESLHATLGR